MLPLYKSFFFKITLTTLTKFRIHIYKKILIAYQLSELSSLLFSQSSLADHKIKENGIELVKVIKNIGCDINIIYFNNDRKTRG